MPQKVIDVAVGELVADPSQPRKSFVKEELQRLAASVAARGILQPIRVRWDQQRGWIIVTGESRWRAAMLAGLDRVPCLPVEGEVTETEILCDQIVENAVRHDLRPLELAGALAKLKALKKCTAQQLAAELGISTSTISRSESLLGLPEEIKGMVDDGRMPESTAYEISRLPDADAQLELARSVAAKRLNRDQAAEVVRGTVGRKNVRAKAGRLSVKLDGGVSVNITSHQPLTRADLASAIECIRKEAKKLPEINEPAATRQAS